MSQRGGHGAEVADMAHVLTGTRADRRGNILVTMQIREKTNSLGYNFTILFFGTFFFLYLLFARLSVFYRIQFGGCAKE